MAFLNQGKHENKFLLEIFIKNYPLENRFSKVGTYYKTTINGYLQLYVLYYNLHIKTLWSLRNNVTFDV